MQQHQRIRMQNLGKRFLAVYSLASLLLGLGLGYLVLRHGSKGFYAIQAPGHGSSLVLNFIVFCISWILIGLLIGLSQFPHFAKRHGIFIFVFALIAFAYLNVIREPHQVVYGDFRAYFLAAVDMTRNQPIQQAPDRLYLYPPLLATILSPFVFLGLESLVKGFHLLNYFALLLHAMLLYLVLQRYRFSRDLAAIVIFVNLIANVPISRTLIYHQVNLHVANLILTSLLLYEKHNFLSALSLSVAIHFKVYPLLLVFPFLVCKQWRWLLWFLVSQAIIVASTSMLNSPYYYLDFIRQLKGLSETALRNSSVDSFLYNTMRLLGIDIPSWNQLLARALRLLLAVGILRVYYQLLDQRVFTGGESRNNRVILNSYVILPLLMIAVSPSIWEHHFVFLILTMVVLFSVLKNAREWWLYLTSYVFIFLIPVYDIYPVSYLRLVAIVLLIGLFHVVAKDQTDGEPGWFARLKTRFLSV
jgi:hypothetical protein